MIEKIVEVPVERIVIEEEEIFVEKIVEKIVEVCLGAVSHPSGWIFGELWGPYAGFLQLVATGTYISREEGENNSGEEEGVVEPGLACLLLQSMQTRLFIC